MQFYVQDPNETIEYQFNWGDLIGDIAITGSTWVADAPIAVSSLTIDGDFTSCKIIGTPGVFGNRYRISNTITTEDGQAFTDSIFIYFENK